ncbi:hypothetical protein [Nocardiopsis alba]|uniref:Uncharacterized protein n=1 Tax=Nocardiopsis alba TaxID=53437 RepID=A0A7K2J0J8_9ACTN|nr:hypothetical protein [Nocardiopsis alba]MYR30715.1 hypothetical protein [Nocardiopsis alba]MYR35741.1 hypothetical protein [Nocardiopsis alba]
MVTTDRSAEVAGMLGHPSAIEQLAADYPEYEIYRERRDRRHGDWIAARDDVEVRASSAEELRRLLQEAAR